MKEEQPPSERPQTRTRFSIKSVMVLTAVLAAAAASMAHLWRAAQSEEGDVGQFVIFTAMLPMLILVAASWFFKIFGRIIK